MKRRISWITSDSFIDVDLPIIRNLCQDYDITWFVVESYSNTLNYKELIKKGISDLHVNVEYLKLKNRTRNLIIILEFLSLFLKLKKQKSDLYYFDFYGFPYFFIFFSRFFTRKKSIIAVHNVSTPKGAVNYKIAKRYTHLILDTFQNIHVFSESQLNVLKSKYPNKNILFTPLALKDFGKSELKPQDKITFLYFGFIRRYKRVDVLIEAAQKAFDETQIPFLVKIAGDCKDWGKYQKLIKYNFLFDLQIESIPNEKIPNLFSSSHYYILPYQDIAQSGALTVGLNYNIPPIASDLPAFREFINDGETGFIMETADIESLKKILVYILKNHDKIYPDLKKNLSNFVTKNLSLYKIVSSYKNYINSILDEKY